MSQPNLHLKRKKMQYFRLTHKYEHFFSRNITYIIMYTPILPNTICNHNVQKVFKLFIPFILLFLLYMAQFSYYYTCAKKEDFIDFHKLNSLVFLFFVCYKYDLNICFVRQQHFRFFFVNFNMHTYYLLVILFCLVNILVN